MRVAVAAQELTIAGVQNVRCLRLTFVGELGFELHMPYEHAPSVYAALHEAGAKHSAATGRPIVDVPRAGNPTHDQQPAHAFRLR